MAHVKVTVNGRPVDMWIDEEENKEIREFYADEMKGFKKMCRKPIVSKLVMHNVTKAIAGPNNTVRFS